MADDISIHSGNEKFGWLMKLVFKPISTGLEITKECPDRLTTVVRRDVSSTIIG